ncbi:MAG TPA: hypothetical protein VFO55_14585 [Gemmatimonadaceae bacterium]|nr:hypothetical protein [Gemmatimonadaceae bacterium]
MTRSAVRALTLLAGSIVVVGCAPRLKPLGGEIAPVSMPRTVLPPIHRQVVFDWEYSDADMSGKGQGVARIAPPDSARLDFFLAGGYAGGSAILIGDSLQLPGVDLFRRLIPPPTLLWASLGKSAFPVTRDTAIRRENEFLRADLGRPVEWRATFRADSLIRLERVDGDRIVEWIERGAGDRIEYRQEAARRTLKLHVTRVDTLRGFDAAIWSLNR